MPPFPVALCFLYCTFKFKCKFSKDIDTISYELDEDKNKIAIIYYTALDFAPGYDIDQIYNALETVL